jgi:site-specific DNA recombinase
VAGFTSFEAMRGSVDALQMSAALRGMKGKQFILTAGPKVRVRSYSRASHDPSGTQSSVTTQDRRNDSTVAEFDWTLIQPYSDNDRPASKRARKIGRPGYEQMLEDMRADPGDLLLLFEMARGSRDLAVYVALRDFCLENGPYYWMVGGNLYDLRDKNDKQQLNAMASQAEGGSDNIAEAVLAGLESQALDGRPHGQTPFGYQRFKHPITGKFLSQALDERDQGGWNPAGVVREIFKRFLAGVPAPHIADWLNELGVPTARLWWAQQLEREDRILKHRGAVWTEGKVYKILINPHYLGIRLHNGVLTKEECWPAIVDEGVYFAVAQKMSRRGIKGKPTAAQSLLTCNAECGKCGGEIVGQKENITPTKRHVSYPIYRCRRGDCAVPQAEADAFVEAIVVGYLQTAAEVQITKADLNAEVAEARAEAERLRAQLAWWKVRMEDDARPDVTPDDYDRKAAELLPKIRVAEELAARGLPSALTEMAGPDAAAKWEAKGLPERREIVRELVRVIVHPAGRGRRHVPIEQRVTVVRR